MNAFRHWKTVVAALIGLLLSLVGVKTAQAASPAEATQPDAASAWLAPRSQESDYYALTCANDWEEPQFYARVITEYNDLRIRSAPGGRVIGSVPKDWLVVVLQTDATGQWTEITSHYGDGVFYWSAPDLTRGWVASRFLEDMGEFCTKPTAAVGVQILATATAQQYLAHEDWLQVGDRIARNSHW